MRAAIYTRLSSVREGDDDATTLQLPDCRELCERKGYQIVARLTDDDRSAYSGKPRPGYRALLVMAERGEIDVIVAWHADRLHRSPRELEEFIDLVERHGVAVETVHGGHIDLTSPQGRIVARILGATARHESEHKAARLRSKHQQKAVQGLWSGGGRRPYGYEKVGVTLSPAEADVVQEAARRVLVGESLRTIVTDFNSRGIKSARGGLWSTKRLKDMLRSARIAGLREHRGATTKAVWPGIISEGQHLRLREKFQPGKRNSGGTLLHSGVA